MSEKKKELVPVLIDWEDTQFYPKGGSFKGRDLEDIEIDNWLSVSFLIKEESGFIYIAQEYFEAFKHWKYIMVFPQNYITKIINLESGFGSDQRIVQIMWLDCFWDDVSYDNNDLEDGKKQIENNWGNIIGWVVKETATHYYLARSYLPVSKQFEKLHTVPKKIIESVIELKKPQEV